MAHSERFSLVALFALGTMSVSGILTALFKTRDVIIGLEHACTTLEADAGLARFRVPMARRQQNITCTSRKTSGWHQPEQRTPLTERTVTMSNQSVLYMKSCANSSETCCRMPSPRQPAIPVIIIFRFEDPHSLRSVDECLPVLRCRAVLLLWRRDCIAGLSIA